MASHIISAESSILEALRHINDLHPLTMTLFVADENRRILGSLTDGDIRRGLISGVSLMAPVREVMFKNFRFVRDISDVEAIRDLRERHINLVPLLDEEGRLVKILDIVNHKSHLPVDAVLMAGGKGERLRPLTLTTPKPLLKIGNEAIIDRNITRLEDFGIRNISVTVNYLKELMIEHFKSPTDRGVTVKCVPEDRFFGTIGSLKLVGEFENDTILVMNSDLLTDINFEDMYLYFKKHGAMMAAAAIPYTVSIPYGIFELDGRNIKGVTEKPTYSLYANAGIYMLRREALRYIPDNEVFNATDLMEALLADGKPVVRFPLTGLWIDIGTPDEYRKAQEIVRFERH